MSTPAYKLQTPFFPFFNTSLRVVLVASLAQPARLQASCCLQTPNKVWVPEINPPQAGQEVADFTHTSSSPFPPSHYPFQLDLQLQDNITKIWKTRELLVQAPPELRAVGKHTSLASQQNPPTTQNELNFLEKKRGTSNHHPTQWQPLSGFSSRLRKTNRDVLQTSHIAKLKAPHFFPLVEPKLPWTLYSLSLLSPLFALTK